MDQIPGAAEQSSGASAMGHLSPDGRHFWSGSEWLSVMSPDGRWHWDGRTWVGLTETATQPGASRGRGRARLLQALLGAWIAAVVVELFIYEFWFSVDYTSSSGSEVVLRWGIVSTVLAGTIGVATLAWLIPIARPAFRTVRDSQSVDALLACWVGLGILYVVSDVFLAEGVRGIAINGPETRLPLLLSAALGIAAAATAIVLVHAVTAAVAVVERR
jgi:hypothetical protein